MDRIAQYRKLIQQILTRHNQTTKSRGNVEHYLVLDQEGDHYQWMTIGWEEDKRIYGCLIHIDIKDSKIWIQYDGTEIGVANQLIELGVPNQDIVLAFQAPYARQYTDFAVG